MALISCPECGKEVSDKAMACPHCGRQLITVNGFWDRCRHWLGVEDREGRWLNRPIGCITSLLIFAVVVVIAVAGITINHISYRATSSQTVSGKHAEFEVKEGSVKFERRTNNSTVYVTGKITNYREKACYIEMVYAIYDTSGNTIYVSSVMSEKSIQPTKNFSFKVEYYDEAAQAASFKIVDLIGHG